MGRLLLCAPVGWLVENVLYVSCQSLLNPAKLTMELVLYATELHQSMIWFQCTLTGKNTRIDKHVCIHTHTHMHARTHTHTHTHTYRLCRGQYQADSGCLPITWLFNIFISFGKQNFMLFFHLFCFTIIYAKTVKQGWVVGWEQGSWGIGRVCMLWA